MNLQNTKKQIRKSRISTVDDVGSLYMAGDRVYRGINAAHVKETLRLLECGLIERLVRDGLFPETKVSELSIENFSLVLEHKKITPVIYPYEWSPEMLRRAAVCVLEVNKRANEYGYELKDAHPYNVVFEYDRPLYVDFGSIVKRNCEFTWIAREEFVNCYASVLSLVERGLGSIYKHAFLLKGTGLDGTELAVITSPMYSVLGKKITRRVVAVFSKYRRSPAVSDQSIERRVRSILLRPVVKFFLRSKMMPFRDSDNASLRRKVESYNLTGKSMWGNYHHAAGFYYESGDIKLTQRMEWVVQIVKELGATSIVELAGNQGILSKTIAKLPDVEQVICTDYDEKAVDQLLLKTKGEKVFMACFDFMGDVREALTRERSERFKSDLVIALAVTHHLLLTQKYSIDAIFSSIASFTRKHLIIEFMPLGLWDGTSAPPIPDWYSEEWFAENMGRYFKITKRVSLEENRVAFVGELLAGEGFCSAQHA